MFVEHFALLHIWYSVGKLRRRTTFVNQYL
jgi:hypothetical protein